MQVRTTLSFIDTFALNQQLTFVTHAPCISDEEYVRRQLRAGEEMSGDSMMSLRWDGATLRKVYSETTRPQIRNVRRILVRAVNAPLTPEAKKILKI